MKHFTAIHKNAARAAVALSLALSATLAGPSDSLAGTEDYIGEISLVAGTFCPSYTMECAGQLLPIAQNTALFSLLGTTYGGNGQTTFALPDLRGRVPIGVGQGPGLSSYTQGQLGGTENETLISTQMPVHNHTASFSQPASSTAATKGSPDNTIPAVAERSTATYTDAVADKTMRAGNVTVGTTGGSQPHNNMQPHLAMRYCITVNGIYPSRP